MPSKTTPTMRLASKKHADNINKRGLVPKTLAKKDYDYPVGPMMLAFFVFVVIGSAIFQVLQSVRTGQPE
eukprot:m.223792 g.223792  ORF g.223792 m.223792 type:complete len:70 (+) comp16326_c0_seq1:170-379(+)